MKKHTKGSWKTEYKRGTGRKVDFAERDANARLIAAAPGLLKACKAVEILLVNSLPIGDPGDCLHLVRAAIAKAEGTE